MWFCLKIVYPFLPNASSFSVDGFSLELYPITQTHKILENPWLIIHIHVRLPTWVPSGYLTLCYSCKAPLKNRGNTIIHHTSSVRLIPFHIVQYIYIYKICIISQYIPIYSGNHICGLTMSFPFDPTSSCPKRCRTSSTKPGPAMLSASRFTTMSCSEGL